MLLHPQADVPPTPLLYLTFPQKSATTPIQTPLIILHHCLYPSFSALTYPTPPSSRCATSTNALSNLLLCICTTILVLTPPIILHQHICVSRCKLQGFTNLKIGWDLTKTGCKVLSPKCVKKPALKHISTYLFL